MSVEPKYRNALALLLAMMVGTWAIAAEAPNLGVERITQDQITSGELTLDEIRRAGMLVFTTPFNRLDGYGDGPMNRVNTISPGGRPTLQGNGMFLRVNGLDAQTCLECHAIVSARTIPATLGIGGVGGSGTNAMFMPSVIEPGDEVDLDGAADFNGRFINPPFTFGVGGVELVGLEMTADLQALKEIARSQPDAPIDLVTKGVSFGSITADAQGYFDTSKVVGVSDDLVVRPFGRKGEFATTRSFDIGAMMFHFGMQPVEAVGAGNDSDQDGVVDEILVGELSALGVFLSTLERPAMEPLSPAAIRGFNQFSDVGCVGCHIPTLNTITRMLPLRFPEIEDRPSDNTYYKIDLTHDPANFDTNGHGGVRVPLFADLKRHDMGDDLAESFTGATEQRNREFTTARLWGVADTAPYLHDGRATTLTDAILMHGGEARIVRDAFDALPESSQDDVIEFLRSLRTPISPAADLLADAHSKRKNAHASHKRR